MPVQTHRRQILSGTLGAAVASFIAQAKAHAQGNVAAPAPMPSIETFARTPLVHHIALSPDGKRVAAVSQQGDTKVLITFDIADNKPNTLIIGKEKVRDLFWGDNEHVILVDSTTLTLEEFTGRSEFWYARSINPTTSKVVTFFRKIDATTRSGGILGSENTRFYPIVFGELSRIKVKDEYRVTAANINMVGDFNRCLYSFSPTSSIGKPMVAAPKETEDFVLTPEGDVVAYSMYDELRKEWSLAYHVGLGTSSQKFVGIYKTKGEVLNRPTLVGLGRDGKSVVISLKAQDGDDYNYHEIGADGALSAPLSLGLEGKRGYPLFHPITWRLDGFRHYEDMVVYQYQDPLMKKLYESVPKVLGDGYRSYPVEFADDPRKMIVYSEGADDAGSYYFIDFTTGAGTQVGADYPNLPVEWIAPKQPIAYQAADGLTIHGYLSLPPFKTAKNLPLIVLPHGGPQARDYMDFEWQAQTLASRGYAVLQPNFRGSSGYGEAFVNAGHGEWGRKMQTDLSDGVRHLVKQGIVDPKRVAIVGASYGGYAAMAGATLDPGVYNCAIAIAGVSDLKAMVEWEDNNTGNSESTTVLYWKRFMGDPTQWDEVSPAKQAAKAYCPILLIHGTDDTVVPFSQSTRMEQALKAAGKPVELITYKGQDHWETIESARIDMMNRVVDFLRRHNPA